MNIITAAIIAITIAQIPAINFMGTDERLLLLPKFPLLLFESTVIFGVVNGCWSKLKSLTLLFPFNLPQEKIKNPYLTYMYNNDAHIVVLVNAPISLLFLIQYKLKNIYSFKEYKIIVYICS